MSKILTSEYTLDFVLPQLESMDDDEFFAFCQQNKNLKIERDENHQIIFMPPEGIETAITNGDIFIRLGVWNMEGKLGKVSGSSGGYTLPDGSVRSPDAAWVSLEKWSRVDKDDRKKFAHVCPDFVIELMSPSDNQPDAKAKMQKWIQNGVLLAWLIDPKTKETFIYRADGTISKTEGFCNTLSGENVLPGFVFDLAVLEQ